MHFYYAKRDCDRYLEKSIDFVLPFPLAATIPFYRFTEIRVSLNDVCKGLKLVWIHLGNVAFERCIDVLVELIEKYAGKFAMDDIGYDYCVYIGNTPVTLVYSYKNLGDRLKDYYRQCYHNQDSGMKSEKSMCQKAS